MNRIVSATLCALALTPMLNGIARAQIDYDPTYNVYFVTGDTTIDTNISGNDVFVGKDNATDFNTVYGPFTLNVNDGAVITGLGNFYPDGFHGGLNVFGDNSVDFNGGFTQVAFAFDASSLNLYGGDLVQIFSHDNSSANIGGGTTAMVSSYNNSVMNVSGGSVSDIHFGYDDSVINITGGTVNQTFNFDNAAANISGGEVNFVGGGGQNNHILLSGGTVHAVGIAGASVLNVTGGNVGGIDLDLNDFEDVGIFVLNGTFNLYGNGFALSNTLAGDYEGTPGTYSTLTGTLLDGTALNTTFFAASGVTFEDLGGGTQDNPLLPDITGNGVFTFNGVPSGAWFDPPLVGAYDFTMTGGDLFTAVLGFPSGIGDADNLFTVSVGSNVLGQFAPGTSVRFADYGYAGGVSAFTISGINPLVDSADPNAFPIQLAFSSAFASFTMQGSGAAPPADVPEPSLAYFALAVCGALGLARTVAVRRRTK